MTVPLDRIDLSPPIGYGKGLPLTMPFKVSGSYGVTGALADRVDAATDLWQRGENINIGTTFSAMWTIGTPILDSIKGFLFQSQFIAGQAPSPFSTDSDNKFMAYSMSTGVTYSSAGRSRGIAPRASTSQSTSFFSNGIFGDGAGPIGNHAHQVGPIEQISNAMTQDQSEATTNWGGYGRVYDRQSTAALPVLHDTAIGCSLSMFKDSESSCVGHQSQVALASGGNGRQWGDAHDTIFNATLSSSALAVWMKSEFSTKYLESGFADRISKERLFKDPSHWAINLYSQAHHPFSREPMKSTPMPFLTDNLSSPPQLNDVDILATPDGLNFDYTFFKRDLANWQQPIETIQAFAIKEPIGGSEVIRELGPAYLGNHAVFDMAGLIGFEGTIVASAFYTISNDRERDSSQTSVPYIYPTTGDIGMHFAGLNIQVTTGTPVRRAGITWLPSGMKGTRFGSDGELATPMMDCMRTTGSMKTHDGTIEASASDTNMTTFFTGRTGLASMTPIGSTDEVTHSIGLQSRQIAQGVVPNRYILGDTQALSDAFSDSQTTVGSTGMVGTERIGARWLADYVPTKIKIIPSLVGYEEVNVSAGDSKSASYDSTDGSPATPSIIKFKKPIVDYHILVSVCERPSGNIRSDSASGVNPFPRNIPSFDELAQNMDLSQSEYVIMHSIFRINPTTLEQVFHGSETVGDFGGGRNSATYSHANGHDQVMPRKVVNESDASQQGWGLHQLTPFRPIRSADWHSIPKMLGMIEPAGMFQRGGISPLFDADAYGNELLVAANLSDCTALGGGTPTTDSKTGKDWFGPIWRFGQKWAGAPQVSPGQELMIFRYSPANDPWYRKANTNILDNPLYERINALSATSYLSGTFNTDLHNDRDSAHSGGLLLTSDSMAKTQGTDGQSWSLHDWVYPRVELMKYLGVENKASPSTYPIISCSALRIMDDGRMMMAAVQRDSITATTQYPDSVIGYPPNPDNAYPRCPAGYYFDGTSCVPMMATTAVSGLGGHYNPDSEADSADPTPSPQIPPSSSSPSLDSSTIFGDYPTYTKLIASSGARSLIMLWTDSPAKNGRVVQGRCDFSGKWSSDHAGGWTWSQTFNQPDTWWSGARTAYWFAESGQRAIPCVYGAYPEVRLSNVSLPRSMPAITPTGSIIEGYPMTQMIGRMAMQVSGHLYGAHASAGVDWATDSSFVWGQQYQGFDPLWSEHQNWLKRTWYIPTVYGATDFAAGCKPFGNYGWSAWGLPADLIDPLWSNSNTYFPYEGANAAEQILSGFSSSMGLHSGVSFVPNQSNFLNPLLDQQQYLLLTYDFGLFNHFPQGSGLNKGSIESIVINGTLTPVTSFSVQTPADILSWIQTSLDSPFATNPALYGTARLEGHRVVIPVVLMNGVNIGQHLSILLDMSESALTDEEYFLVEPFFLQAPNLVDPLTFTPTP